MKFHNYIVLIQYVIKILSVKDDFSAFPCYLTYKIIARFIEKLKRKLCIFRVYLEKNENRFPFTGDIITEHRIFVNEKCFPYLCQFKEEPWIHIEIKSLQKPETKRQYTTRNLVYQLVPVTNLHPISSCFTTSKGYNELYHVIPSNHVYINFSSKSHDIQTIKNASIAIISYHELSNSDADFILGKYFETPRFLHSQETYEIELKEELLGSLYYAEYFLTFSKLKSLVFIVTNLENKYGKIVGYGVIMKNITTLRQVQNDNYRIPRKVYQSINFPLGLKSYVGQLVSSIEPFLNKNYMEDYSTQPIFLVEGNRGSGQEIVVAAAAERLGFSIKYVDCLEVMANLTVHAESKLSNIMLKSTSHNALIVCFENFEVFGCSDRNNQTDLRLMLAFEAILDQFFNKNKRSIIIASSNSLITQWKIKSIFLQTIVIKSLNKYERLKILLWLFEKKNFFGIHQRNINNFVHKAVEKTNGLNYGDLQILVDNFLLNDQENQKDKDYCMTAFEKEANLLFQSCKENTLTIPKVEWNEIGGLQELKSDIQNSIKLPMKHKHLMGRYMKRSGILLHGPPGTGKTLIAKAVATEHQINFISVQGPELLNMYVGQSEENVRNVFANAKANSPCVVFLDELDSLAPNRGNSADSGGVMDRVVSQLLAELDAILSDPSCQIFILGATNRPDLIDTALLRPGRFDKLLYVGSFTKLDEKVTVLETVTKQFQLSATVSLKDLAESLKTEITGAEVYSLCSNSWLNAVRKTFGNKKDQKVRENLITKNDICLENIDFYEALRLLGLGKN